MNRIALAARCPSFGVCSAPLCPLDADQDKRGRRQAGEEKCRAHKPTRQRIVAEALGEGGEIAALAAELPHAGLSAREAAGAERGAEARARWEAMTDDERAAVRARLQRPS